MWQVVGDVYTWLWDLFWLPIRFIANRWPSKVVPERWTPWFFGARVGRWPEKMNYDHFTICTDADCEICRSLKPGELDIDDETETTHDPFHVLSRTKAR